MSTGGQFQEILSKKRHLLVTDLPAKGEKFNFAVRNNIPVVTAEWFQECLNQSRRVPFAEFLVEKQKEANPARFEDPESSKRAGDVGESGYNKRPRLSGMDFQGKLLGENLQSFGDRLRRKIPEEKTGADADAKTSGPPSKNRHTKDFGGDIQGEQMGGSLSVHGGETREKMSILHGCVVYVSRQLNVHGLPPTSSYGLQLTSLKHRLVALN